MHEIVQAHGGSINVTSRPGEGADFAVSLPAAQIGATVTVRKPSERPSSPKILSRILLVDDDLRVLRVHARMLAHSFTVEAVSSGAEALEKLNDSEEWAAIVCDLMMPGLNGLQLLDKTKERWPELAKRFVFVSGGVADDEMRSRLVRDGLNYLYKPFSGKRLISRVNAIAQ